MNNIIILKNIIIILKIKIMAILIDINNYIQSRLQTQKFLLNTLLFLFLISYTLNVVQDSCYNVKTYGNNDCFNDKIVFKNNFRAGHFETLKDGTLKIEYSSDTESKKRFFYGLKKNGRYYFENESPFRRFEVHNPVNNYHGRYESENKIIYISTDTNKEKEYLFSTSIYTTVTELHDIEGNRSLYWNTTSFWQICEIFSYEINILDLPENGENHYLCAFTQHENHKRMFNGELYDYSTTFSLRKFKFDTFGSFSILGTKVNYTSNYNSRMISAFIVYDMEIIVVFFLKKIDADFVDSRYTLAFYNYDLEWKNEEDKGFVSKPESGNGIFFRSFLIKDKWAAFIYFPDKSGNTLNFEIGELVLVIIIHF
jgi:hypothetical protein